MDPPADLETASPSNLSFLPEGYLPQPYFYFPPFLPNLYHINGTPVVPKPIRLTPCRNGNSCIFMAQGRCKFYHGPPIPNSPPFRRKPCRFGDTCKYYEQGICNFYHPQKVDNLPDEDGKPQINSQMNQENNQTQTDKDEHEDKQESKSKSPS